MGCLTTVRVHVDNGFETVYLNAGGKYLELYSWVTDRGKRVYTPEAFLRRVPRDTNFRSYKIPRACVRALTRMATVPEDYDPFVDDRFQAACRIILGPIVNVAINDILDGVVSG